MSLYFVGVVAPQQLAIKWHQRVYRIYRISIPIALAMAGIHYLLIGYLKLVVREPFAVEFAMAPLFGLFGPLFWKRICKEFGIGGPYMSVLQQVARRGFSFEGLWFSVWFVRLIQATLVVSVQ